MSDVIVAGTATFDHDARAGRIAPLRVKKGMAAKSYRIVWDPVDMGSLDVACPTWFPVHDRERATYYLEDRGDGTFIVLGAEKSRPLD